MTSNIMGNTVVLYGQTSVTVTSVRFSELTLSETPRLESWIGGKYFEKTPFTQDLKRVGRMFTRNLCVRCTFNL